MPWVHFLSGEGGVPGKALGLNEAMEERNNGTNIRPKIHFTAQPGSLGKDTVPYSLINVRICIFFTVCPWLDFWWGNFGGLNTWLLLITKVIGQLTRLCLGFVYRYLTWLQVWISPKALDISLELTYKDIKSWWNNCKQCKWPHIPISILQIPCNTEHADHQLRHQPYGGSLCSLVLFEASVAGENEIWFLKIVLPFKKKTLTCLCSLYQGLPNA